MWVLEAFLSDAITEQLPSLNVHDVFASVYFLDGGTVGGLHSWAPCCSSIPTSMNCGLSLGVWSAAH